MIPEIDPKTLELTKKARFSDAAWLVEESIVIGGQGGIGSWLSLYLSRIGHELFAYDMDTVDYVNMAGQLYPVSSIGKSKSETMKQVVKDFAGHDKFHALGRYNPEDGLQAGIMISAFDNMEARSIFFERWCAYEKKELFIDARMTAEMGQIFCVRPEDIDAYKATLFPDADVPDAPCSWRATSHNGAMIGAYITALLNNYLVNRVKKADFRVVPFYYEYELALLSTVQTVPNCLTSTTNSNVTVADNKISSGKQKPSGAKVSKTESDSGRKPNRARRKTATTESETITN